MEYEISLKRLRFHAYHGVLPLENKVGNEFILDISLRIPYSETAAADSLDGTISYADIYSIIEEEMGKTSRLMESVIARIHQRLIHKYPIILSGNISLCKSRPPIPNIDGEASVSIIF